MIGRLFLLRKGKNMFQLCPKMTSLSYFSTEKNNFPSNENISEKTQNIKQSAKKSMQKLKRMKQQQRQEQYQQKLQQINVTQGNFNPLTGYFWLHRKSLFLISFGLFLIYLLIDEDSLFCYRTMGVFQDPFTKKKRFLAINPYRENVLQNAIISIIEKQVDFLNQQSLQKKNLQVNKVLQRKLQAILSKIQAKYKIKFKARRNNDKNYEIANAGENVCLWVVGDQKLIVSTQFLKMSAQSVQNLILLLHSLHSRYVHIQNVSFWERMNLKETSKTQNIIKIEKTFVSNVYSSQNIAQTIELIAERYQKDEQSKNKLKQSLYKSMSQLLSTNQATNTEIQKGKQFPEYDLRNRMRNFS